MSKILQTLSLLFILVESVSGQQWTNTLNGQGDFTSVFNATTSDPLGNIYLCGATVNINQNKDILVVKTNSSGDTLWTNVYDGPANGMDEALAIAVDNNSNVFITGYHRGSGTGTDMVTIKYNPAGIIQWVQPYLSSVLSDQTDRGNSIALDASGNIYITGQSDSDPSILNNDDYITIKYNNSGTQQWISIKDGIGSGTDRPVKILLDASNNPIVTGRSFNGAEDDYLTIKYNGSNGSTLWEQIVDRTHYDRPTDMVINLTNGNVYVTGRSKNITYDYVTVAYSSAGALLWTGVYDYIDDDRATSIALTSAGEIIVSGQSDYDLTANFNYNISTVKYSTSGAQLWVKTFVGSAGNDDIPTDLITDLNGNVFVSGYTDTDAGLTIQNDAVLLGYSSTGTSLFTKTYSFSTTSNDIHSAIYLALNNDIIVCGSSEFIPVRHGTYLRYSNTGNELWSKTHIAKGDNSSNSHSIVVDAQGNSYVAGYSVEYNADRNHSLQKIDGNGNTIWIKTLNGTSTSGSPDEAYGVAIDAAGFIYVGGYVKNTGTSYDIILAKYNSLGDTIWTRIYDYVAANASDKALALALDNSGNIYLTGRSDNDPGVTSNDDAITLKYNSSGTLLWSQRYNGTGNSSDQTRIIKLSNSGNVYVAGKSNNGNNNDLLIIKYSSAGVQQWVKTYDGTGTDEVLSMELDNSENILVTGFTQSSLLSDTNLIVLKLNSAGVQQWVQIIDGAAHGKDLGNSIVCDNTGNVIVAGTTDSDALTSTLNNDIIILKYDSNGNELWRTTYDNSSNFDDEAEEVKLDANNDIYITGMSDSSSLLGENYDYIALKFLNTGVISRQFRFNGEGNSRDIPSTLYVKGLDFFVTGGSINSSGQKDLVTVHFSTDPNASISELYTQNCSVYPNPASEYFTIRLNEEYTNSSIKYHLYSISGQLLISDQVNAGSVVINTSVLASGTYILKLTQNENQLESLQIEIN